ncbi:Ras guanine nucleotide exchange factor Q [Planoprotostelium fungivorum]|uniref:Ras guanine nucleotide exchange factor Q n=1 Tax=Planoprotostelium fungivorum TaxID=1890364 RepID=A0A2P6NUR7_9EUKA|nr:Ras guanine nucleotide exchange factor Q [Planoprotostelium fungivorum]
MDDGSATESQSLESATPIRLDKSPVVQRSRARTLVSKGPSPVLMRKAIVVSPLSPKAPVMLTRSSGDVIRKKKVLTIKGIDGAELKQKGVKRSKSETMLVSWERPEYEEIKQRFEDLLEKERIAAIRTEEEVRSLAASLSAYPPPESPTIPTAAAEEDSSDEENTEMETQLEGGQLLVGIKDSHEIILAGTVDQLYENLTTRRFGKIITAMKDLISPPFVVEFLYTYRYFTSYKDSSKPPAHELLSRITEMYRSNISDNTTPEVQAVEGSNQLRIIGVLKTWIEIHFYDFEEDFVLFSDLLSLVLLIVQHWNASSSTNGVREWSEHVIKQIILKLCGMVRRRTDGIRHASAALEKVSNICNPVPLLAEILPHCKFTRENHNRAFTGTQLISFIMEETKCTRDQGLKWAEKLYKHDLIQGDTDHFQENFEYSVKIPKISPPVQSTISVFDVRSSTIAQQLTLIDFELFKKITPKELSHQAWNQPNAREVSPNVMNSIDRINRVSYWVATEITACFSLRKRVSVMKKFISVAQSCLELRNFASLFAVCMGLNLGCVQIMKKTWAALPKSFQTSFSELSEIVGTVGNFKKYRRLMKTIELPAIPYIAVTLKDLTFIEDGNKTWTENNMVNFAKMTMLASAFEEVAKCQKVEYSFEVDNVVREAVTDLFVVTDLRELYKNAKATETEGGHGSDMMDTGSPRKERRATMYSSITFEALGKAWDSLGKKNSKEILRSSIKPESVPSLPKSPQKPSESPRSAESPRSSEVKKSPRGTMEEPRGHSKSVLDWNRSPSKTSTVDLPKYSPRMNLSSDSLPRGVGTRSLSQSSPAVPNSLSEEREVNSTPSPLLDGMKESIKIMLVGDGTVGKTSLLVSYTSGAFLTSEYLPTIFDNYSKIEKFEGKEINLILWDSAGQEEFANIRKVNYPGTDCFLICYSIDSIPSIRNVVDKVEISLWIPEIRKHSSKAIIGVVGTKEDMEARPECLSFIQAEQYLKKVKYSFHVRTSAKTGNNVKEAFAMGLKTVKEKSKKLKLKKRATLVLMRSPLLKRNK